MDTERSGPASTVRPELRGGCGVQPCIVPRHPSVLLVSIAAHVLLLAAFMVLSILAPGVLPVQAVSVAMTVTVNFTLHR